MCLAQEVQVVRSPSPFLPWYTPPTLLPPCTPLPPPPKPKHHIHTPTPTPILLQAATADENWCGVLQEVAFPGCGGGAGAFLDAVVPYCNDKCWGTLSCAMIIHPSSQVQWVFLGGVVAWGAGPEVWRLCWYKAWPLGPCEAGLHGAAAATVAPGLRLLSQPSCTPSPIHHPRPSCTPPPLRPPPERRKRTQRHTTGQWRSCAMGALPSTAPHWCASPSQSWAGGATRGLRPRRVRARWARCGVLL